MQLDTYDNAKGELEYILNVRLAALGILVKVNVDSTTN